MSDCLLKWIITFTTMAVPELQLHQIKVLQQMIVLFQGQGFRMRTDDSDVQADDGCRISECAAWKPRAECTACTNNMQPGRQACSSGEIAEGDRAGTPEVPMLSSCWVAGIRKRWQGKHTLCLAGTKRYCCRSVSTVVYFADTSTLTGFCRQARCSFCTCAVVHRRFRQPLTEKCERDQSAGVCSASSSCTRCRTWA